VKKALTLIELIFTMVIIAFTFTVIPKMFQASNKSLETSSKEDGLFNMYSKMMDIVLKEYDEENTKFDDILLSGNSGVLECNVTTGYRIGGFKGSRNCFNGVVESDIGPDSGETSEDDYDDVDDYNGTEDNITSGNKQYELNISVGYTDNWSSSNYNGTDLEFNFTNTSDNTYRHIKRVEVKLIQNNRVISSLKYYSSNLGHTKIKSVLW